MSEDTTSRLFAKLDDLSDRMARVEVKIDEHNKYAATLEHEIGKVQEDIMDHDRRINELEQTKAGATSVKEFIGWAVAIVAAIWGVLK